ncbi:MAG: MarR family transcriptional regulator [Candidatus Dormibacteraceae bacterium]
MATVSLTPLERRLLDTVRVRGEMHGRQLASELEADSGAVARCLVHLEALGLLQSETLGRTKRYQVRSAEQSTSEAVLERIEEFDDPRPLAVLRCPPGPLGEPRIIVVLPGIWIPLHAWLALRRLARRFEQPVEVLVYSDREARRLARLPGNPVREALKEDPERGVRLMEPPW